MNIFSNSYNTVLYIVFFIFSHLLIAAINHIKFFYFCSVYFLFLLLCIFNFIVIVWKVFD